MNTKLNFVFLIAILAIAVVSSFVGALQISNDAVVEVNTINADAFNVAVVAGETYPVTIEFTAEENASDVEVSAWIQGERRDRTDRVFYDLVEGMDYKVRTSVVIPNDVEPEEELTFYVRIETDSGNWEGSYTVYAQREAHNLDFLLVDMDNSVRIGSTTAVTVVLKNMGRHDAEDTLVSVKIPELGIVKRAYFEDLYSVEDSDEDDYDSRERKIFLSIPSNAQEGTYDVEITAYTDDTESSVTKTLSVIGSDAEGKVLTNPSSKTFAVGEEVKYELVLVNTGKNIVVYDLVTSDSDALSVTLSESTAIVPAGSSKVVTAYVKANREGTFGYTVSVTSDGFSEIASYSATVEGKSIGNNLVALTIVLAIIFVVLIVILAVLLTRKPEKTEEFGESYY